VILPKLLYEGFLATVQSKYNITCEQKQFVFLLIFGYSIKRIYEIAIGKECENYHVLLLIINLLKQIIGSRINIRILLTSCFSSNWVIQLQLNIIVITAAELKQTSEF
jgi:hypothetical protein